MIRAFLIQLDQDETVYIQYAAIKTNRPRKFRGLFYNN